MVRTSPPCITKHYIIRSAHHHKTIPPHRHIIIKTHINMKKSDFSSQQGLNIKYCHSRCIKHCHATIGTLYKCCPMGVTSNVTMKEQCYPEAEEIVPEALHWMCRPPDRAAFIILHDTRHTLTSTFFQGKKSSIHGTEGSIYLSAFHLLPKTIIIFIYNRTQIVAYIIGYLY